MVKVLQQNTWIDDRKFLNHVCKLGQSKAISITLHMVRGQQEIILDLPFGFQQTTFLLYVDSRLHVTAK